MASPTPKKQNKVADKATKRKRKKLVKIIVSSVAGLVAVTMATVVILGQIRKNEAVPTSVTTYHVDEITFGDVNTTLSGSGTLSPVLKESLTLSLDALVSEEETEEETETETEEETTEEETSKEETAEDETSENETDAETEAETEPETNDSPAVAATGTYGESGSMPSMGGTVTPTAVYTVDTVNCVPGDRLEEGYILAIFTDEDGVEYDYPAPYDCVILDMTLSEGQELSTGGTVATIMSKDGFTMSLSVDEYDIAVVELGQEVTFEVSALGEEFEGSITNISYSGSSGSYQITASMGYEEGIYPGMSVSAEIVIESSGEGLLVPVDAVKTSGDDNYIYLAPAGATFGDEYAEDELTLSDLERVVVETGMSDGSYILIESDELAEGDLIVITKLTSTLTGSANEDDGGMGGFGGGGMGSFPGGNFGGGERPDFGGDFDPGNMPSGGFPGGFGGFGG